MILQNKYIVLSLSFKEAIPDTVHYRYERIQNSTEFSNLLINKFMHFVERMADELENTYECLKKEEEDLEEEIRQGKYYVPYLPYETALFKQKSDAEPKRQAKYYKCATISIYSLESSIESGTESELSVPTTAPQRKNYRKKFKYMLYQEARASLMKRHPFSNHPNSIIWRAFKKTAGRGTGLHPEWLKYLLQDSTVDDKIRSEIRQCVKETLKDEFYWIEYLKRKGIRAVGKKYVKNWLVQLRCIVY